MAACHNQELVFYELLRAVDVDIKCTNNEDKTVLHYMQVHNLKMIQALSKHADFEKIVNLKDSDKQTAFNNQCDALLKVHSSTVEGLKNVM